MIDKNNIIITKNERIKTLLAFIKNNAVLVPIISFCAAVFTVGVNSFVYTYTISYFNYFGVDAKYMLPVNNMGLYQGLVQGILVMKNYKMKCERYLNESAFRTFFCFKQ